MLGSRRMCINRQIESFDTNIDAIKDDIERSFLKHIFQNSLVTSLTINGYGPIYPCAGKSANSSVSVDTTLTSLMIPPTFIVAGATVFKTKTMGNDTIFILSADFYDENGNKITASVADKDSQPITAFISTMNKSAESLNLYKHLVVGSQVNIVCLTNIIAEGKKQPMSINADIIEKVNPKGFIYNKSIDIERIRALVVKQKVNYPLFANHIHTGNNIELQEGKKYSMSIYGFSEVGDALYDMINLPNAVRHNTPYGTENEIGIDTLSGYLYATMLNWICALRTLSNK